MHFSTLDRKLLYPVLVAFFLRLCWALAIPIIPVSDSVAYDTFAWNIARGLGYGWTPEAPTAYWPVGTSAIYGAVFWIFGHQYFPIAMLQIVIGTLVVVLSISLARRWFDDRVAVTTGWMLACWPLLIQFTTILASEIYFLFFILLALWLAGCKANTWIEWCKYGALAGVSLAAASYVRPLALLMAPLLYVSPLMARPRRRFALAACAVSVVTMSLCILPWSIRNWYVFERFVPISTNGGANLWMGNNPSGSIEYMELPNVEIANEADKDKYFAKLAKQYIAEEPAAFMARTGKKIMKLHDRETIGVAWNEKGIEKRFGAGSIPVLKVVSSIWWWCLLPAAIVGVVFAFKRHIGVAYLPILLWLYFAAIHGISVAGDRYHVPSVPFVAMLFAVAKTSVFKCGIKLNRLTIPKRSAPS